MKKSLLALTTAAIMAVSMSITSWAMTAEEVTAKTPTSYTAGTQSIYGPKLTQEQLNAVAQATADFMTNNITDNMSTDDKIKAAYDYIKTRTTYVDWNAATGANTAYTLVTGQGACSGMCRSMKALCDAMGIECYHVHSTSTDHQWNLVRYGDGILYHVDIDANKSAGQDIIYRSLTHPLPYDTSAYPAVGQAQEQGQEQTPEYTGTGIRSWQSNAQLEMWINEEGAPLYNKEIKYPGTNLQTNGYVIDPSVLTFQFMQEHGNINPEGHTVRIVAARPNGYGGWWHIGNEDGTPKEYPFEYNKSYSFNCTDMSDSEFIRYCQNNDVQVTVWVFDTTVNEAVSKDYRAWYTFYATSQSVPTGEIG